MLVWVQVFGMTILLATWLLTGKKVKEVRIFSHLVQFSNSLLHIISVLGRGRQDGHTPGLLGYQALDYSSSPEVQRKFFPGI